MAANKPVKIMFFKECRETCMGKPPKKVSASRRGRNRSVSGLRRDGRSLAIATKVLIRRFLRRGVRYRKQKVCQRVQETEHRSITARALIKCRLLA
ncbi:hypothetical protein PY85_09885, partial [Lacticaseibacillus rhamnosus]